MGFEGYNGDIPKQELKNNNFNPELNEFLSDNKITQKEAQVLKEMFNENKQGIILVTGENLSKLREAIGSKSRTNYITNSDKNLISNIANTEKEETLPKEVESIFEKSGYKQIIPNDHFKDGVLHNVTKIRLDELVGPVKSKFAIKLSNNSLYSNNYDGKTFNVKWGQDTRTGKLTYVFDEGKLKGRRVLISNGDELVEYQEKQTTRKKQPVQETIIQPTVINPSQESKEFNNNFEANKSFLEGLNLPDNYKKIAFQFILKLDRDEVLTRRTPLALVDSKKSEMLYIINGESTLEPILLGKSRKSKDKLKRLTTGGYVPNDGLTPVGKIHRFDIKKSRLARAQKVKGGTHELINGELVYKPRNKDGKYTGTHKLDASNSQNSTTVHGASLQSDLSNSYGGRYFHGIAQRRIDGNKYYGTYGCVGINEERSIAMYHDIVKNKGGYGYVG